jgi:hypothetical protein
MLNNTFLFRKIGYICGPSYGDGWRYGLVKADHYRSTEEKNLIQPLLTIPLIINLAV